MKYSVVTFIFGNYERLREIEDANYNPDIEYICLTDVNDLQSKTWKIIHVDYEKGQTEREKYYYFKYHFLDYCTNEMAL